MTDLTDQAIGTKTPISTKVARNRGTGRRAAFHRYTHRPDNLDPQYTGRSNRREDGSASAIAAHAPASNQSPFDATQFPLDTAAADVLEQVKASPAVTATDVCALEQALDAARDDRFLDARRRTHTPSPRR
jgi:hypothetical protein